MEYVELGKTGLKVSRTSFGALPIQRVSKEEAKSLLCKAYDNGMNFFDTARGYTDSEEKIGYALADKRKNIIIASKSMATTVDVLKNHLETSLRELKTDYIDIFQFHNPEALPSDEMYECCLQFKKEGKIRFIGITNHSLEIAGQAIATKLYDTLQFPFSSLCDEKDLELVKECKNANIGFIAMKAMSGGLINHVPANFSFIRQFENVVPIWGIQRESELDEFLSLEKNPPVFTDELRAIIEKDRQELSGKFCRGCGYCKPCEAEIPLDLACRLDLLLNRGVAKNFLTEEWQEKMSRIENCTMCQACAGRCPYGLLPYEIIKYQLEYYKEFLANS